MNTLKTIPALRIPKAEIVGPYSEWPRKPQHRTRRGARLASTLVAVAVVATFMHCALPLMAA